MSSSLLSAIPSHPSDFACIDFINSSFTDYTGGGQTLDRLPLEAWQSWFLRRHELVPEVSSRLPVRTMEGLRGELRDIVERWSAARTVTRRDAKFLDDWTQQAELRQRVHLTSDGRLELYEEALRRDWNWVAARLAASTAHLISTHESRRLKTCSNPDCSWMFYDTSVNRSKRFCSTSPCGSLIRVRRFRRLQ